MLIQNILKGSIAFILILILYSQSRAEYLIELKSGVIFKTSHFWEIDETIKFYYHGGVIGFYKGSIEKITEAETDNLNFEEKENQIIPVGPILDETPSTEIPMVPKAPTIAEENRPTEDKAHNSSERISTPRIEDKLLDLKEKSDEAWDQYDEVVRYGTKEEREAARKKAYEIDMKIIELRNKLAAH